MSSKDFRPRSAERISAVACSILHEVDSGRKTLDDALDDAPENFRRTLEHLLLNLYRYRKFLNAEISSRCARPPAAEIRELLLVTYAQCRFQSAIAPESAVNVAVERAKRCHAGSFVNAVLHRLLETSHPLPESAEKILPDPILRRWKKRFEAAEVERLAKLFVSEAEFSFRLLPGSRIPENCAVRDGFGDFRFASGGAGNVLAGKEFQNGNYYIQDPAASLAPSLVKEEKRLLAGKIIDLCAAPGGKTLMLDELRLPGSELTASDISASRQKLTRENFAWRKRTCRIITSDPQDISGTYDIVLADVPCSNTGVFRKRPDALWRFSENELKKVCALQKKIAVRAAELTAPGGVLILSSCSIETEENDGLVQSVLNGVPGFNCENSRTLLPDHCRDGAFAALLRKK